MCLRGGRLVADSMLAALALFLFFPKILFWNIMAAAFGIIAILHQTKERFVAAVQGEVRDAGAGSKS
jgi:hypothetical protein